VEKKKGKWINIKGGGRRDHSRLVRKGERLREREQKRIEGQRVLKKEAKYLYQVAQLGHMKKSRRVRVGPSRTNRITVTNPTKKERGTKLHAEK